MFGAIPDDALDDAGAIQAAIDAACSIIGGASRPARTVLFSEGTYLVQSILNLTNTRLAGTMQRDGIRLAGQGILRTVLQGKTGAGKPIIEVTGAQFLSIANLSLSANGSKGSSTIGIYSGLFAALPQTQNQTFSSIAIFMHDDPTANSGQGTIAYYNFGSEENTHQATYYRANRPAVLTADSRSPIHYASSFGNQLTAHSLG
ncbi:hypothetical protein GO730_05070 [Spirosoma sp. HMF3257]|uniref:Rhamnogalacturonase A/B/Epimerase-like pectate lyase domain-containing protein n=1 Tax=Spirosoma telluris TaxID=2183553 RepID=A0A327NEY1_9BACT|nr:hypothetical protein [Spirosoma telluris]RAI73900.1 hypothetical protein HMF3257_05035 [Spirosoma telluris]